MEAGELTAFDSRAARISAASVLAAPANMRSVSLPPCSAGVCGACCCVVTVAAVAGCDSAAAIAAGALTCFHCRRCSLVDEHRPPLCLVASPQ